MLKKTLFIIVVLGLLSYYAHSQITQSDLDNLIVECYIPPVLEEWDIDWDLYGEYEQALWEDWEEWDWDEGDEYYEDNENYDDWESWEEDDDDDEILDDDEYPFSEEFDEEDYYEDEEYYEEYFLEYDCESDCQDRIAEQDWSILTPCDEWLEYLDGDSYDATNIDSEMASKYADCLMELSYFTMDWPDFEVYFCAGKKTKMHLDKHGVDAFDFTELADCVDTCYADCDQDCEDILAENWEDGFCWYDQVQTWEIGEGIINDDTQFSYLSAEAFQLCKWDNLYYLYDPLEVNWESFYDSYDYDSDSYDLSNLDAYSKAYLTIECEAWCYYPEEHYYDNEQAYQDAYGEYYYEEEYYEDGDFFFEEDWFDDCEGGSDCYNEEGDLIGEIKDIYNQVTGNEKDPDDPCSNGYCFYEWLGCIESCESKHCPASTCYTGANDTLQNEIKSHCQAYVDTKKRLEEAGVISPYNIVPFNYSDQYLKCVNHLEKMAEAAGQEYVVKFYQCLGDCAEEAALKNSNASSLFFNAVLLAIALLLAF